MIMIKTIKEILFATTEHKAIMIPPGTYLCQVGSRYYFQGLGLEDYFIEISKVESWSDHFVEVPNDEPEIRKMFFDFSALLDRIDIRQIIETISKTEPEIIDKICKFFGREDAEELKNKIKDLETRLFLEQCSGRPEKDYYADGKVPYRNICSCNPANGGDGVCGCVMGNTLVDPTMLTKTNFIAPSAISDSFSASSSVFSSYPEGTTIHYTSKKTDHG